MKTAEAKRYTLHRRDENGRRMYYSPASGVWVRALPGILLSARQVESLIAKVRGRHPDAAIVDVIARQEENAIWLSGFRSVVPLGHRGGISDALREQARAAAAAAVAAAGYASVA